MPTEMIQRTDFRQYPALGFIEPHPAKEIGYARERLSITLTHDLNARVPVQTLHIVESKAN